MSCLGPETEYYFERAREESLLALRSFNRAAEAVHREMANRYAAKAMFEHWNGYQADRRA